MLTLFEVDIDTLEEADVEVLVLELVEVDKLDVDDCVDGFKLGGFRLDVGIEYCVPVLLVRALDGKTVTAVFSETG